MAAMKGLIGQKMDPAMLQQLMQAQQQQNGTPQNNMHRQQLMNQAAQMAAVQQAQAQVQQMNGHASPMMNATNGLPMRISTPAFPLPPAASSPMMLPNGMQRASSVSSVHGSPASQAALLPSMSPAAQNEALGLRSPSKRSPRSQNQNLQQQQPPFPAAPFSTPFQQSAPAQQA